MVKKVVKIRNCHFRISCWIWWARLKVEIDLGFSPALTFLAYSFMFSYYILHCKLWWPPQYKETPKNEYYNICSIKFRSKHSSNTALCLLRNLMEQSWSWFQICSIQLSYSIHLDKVHCTDWNKNSRPPWSNKLNQT